MMTNEEAIKLIETIKHEFFINDLGCEALDMAIEALEQEPILDKIRAEIKALSPEPTAYDVVDGNPIKEAVWEIIADALKIIDKYKPESEGQNEKNN